MNLLDNFLKFHVSVHIKSLRAFVTTAEAAAKLAASTKDAEGIAQQQAVDYKLNIRSKWIDNVDMNIHDNNDDNNDDSDTIEGEYKEV